MTDLQHWHCRASDWLPAHARVACHAHGTFPPVKTDTAGAAAKHSRETGHPVAEGIGASKYVRPQEAA